MILDFYERAGGQSPLKQIKYLSRCHIPLRTNKCYYSTQSHLPLLIAKSGPPPPIWRKSGGKKEFPHGRELGGSCNPSHQHYPVTFFPHWGIERCETVGGGIEEGRREQMYLCVYGLLFM
jgi:hypothetical protein